MRYLTEFQELQSLLSNLHMEWLTTIELHFSLLGFKYFRSDFLEFNEIEVGGRQHKFNSVIPNQQCSLN